MAIAYLGMRIKAGGRKAGERRPVLSSAGIRAGANTVVQESPTLNAVGVGGHPLGSRPTEESEMYYNNPNVNIAIDTVEMLFSDIHRTDETQNREPR